jgi:hypothetical protein
MRTSLEVTAMMWSAWTVAAFGRLISIGACVVPDALGPCAPSAPACGENEVCITGECHTLCF